MPRVTCLNLRELFGAKYKIRHEESYAAEKPEFRSIEEPWLQIIPCRHGHIHPHGSNSLGWASKGRGPVMGQVARLPFVTVTQDGSDGVNAIFDVSHFDAVAAIVQPKLKPPKKVLTPEHMEKLQLARAKFLESHPDWKPGQRVTQN